MERQSRDIDRDCTPDIRQKLRALEARGGRLTLPCGAYDIHDTVTVDDSGVCLAGETWACNVDPNGVFEPRHGTKLRMRGRDFAAVTVGREHDPISGAEVCCLGIQGDIEGMDVRPYVDFAHPERMSGLCLDSVRTDQCDFRQLSFCGLAAAVCVTGQAEVDACLFEHLNADGCGCGVWFAPRASYYARFRSCVVADNPYYGLYATSKDGHMHNLMVQDMIFVRNGGCFTDDDELPAAAVLFDRVNNCAVERCLIDDPGTFWYYDEDATHNEQRQPSHRKTAALHVIGSGNRGRDNTILHASAEAIIVEGDRNVLLGNIADGNVVVSGRDNTVINQVFTSPDARLILKGEAAASTTVVGVPEDRIVRL